MTYSKKINNQQDIKKEVIDSVNRNIENTINNMELSISDNTQIYNLTTEPHEDDNYKLVSIMDYQNKIVEINTTPNSKLILGAISDKVEDSDSMEIFLCKTTYCLDNEKLTEGCLIQCDTKLPFYSMLAPDDIYRSHTIGKIVQLHDNYIYFDLENTKRTEGEYIISRQKKLDFNMNPQVLLQRKPSLSSIRSIGSVSSVRNQQTISSRTTSRMSMSAKQTQTPRSIINRYRLVTFL